MLIFGARLQKMLEMCFKFRIVSFLPLCSSLGKDTVAAKVHGREWSAHRLLLSLSPV
jgi:hypothetical protein